MHTIDIMYVSGSVDVATVLQAMLSDIDTRYVDEQL